MRKTPRSVILVYVLLAYVVLQFCWWAYLIYGLNVELINTHPSSDSESEINAKLYMILGEGTVFLSLLIAGAIYIRNYLLREHKRARQERNFLLATTHELNSPLAGIKLNLQTLQREEISKQQANQMVTSGLKNVSRLEGLIQNILMASRIDSGKLSVDSSAVNLSQVINESLTKHQLQLEDAKVSIEPLKENQHLIKGDKRSLEIILGNLISNACKYAKESDVNFNLSTSGKYIELRYSDNGPGVPADYTSTIFNKFFRVENEETRSQKGTGLGLYLVKELVHLQRGKITAHNLQPHGLEIKLLFERYE